MVSAIYITTETCHSRSMKNEVVPFQTVDGFDGNDFKGCTPHLQTMVFLAQQISSLLFDCPYLFAVVKLVIIEDAVIVFLFAEAGSDGLFTDLVGSSLIASDISPS